MITLNNEVTTNNFQKTIDLLNSEAGREKLKGFFDGTLFATAYANVCQEKEINGVTQKQYRVDAYSIYKQVVVDVVDEKNNKWLMTVKDLYDVSKSVRNSSMYLSELESKLISDILPAVHTYNSNKAEDSYEDLLSVTAHLVEGYLNQRLEQRSEGRLKASVRQVNCGDVINNDNVVSIDLEKLTVCYAKQLNTFFKTDFSETDTGKVQKIDIESHLKLDLNKNALMFDLMGENSVGALTNVFEAQCKVHSEDEGNTVYVAITDTDITNLSFPLKTSIMTRFFVFSHLDLLIETTKTVMDIKKVDDAVKEFILEGLKTFKQ